MPTPPATLAPSQPHTHPHAPFSTPYLLLPPPLTHTENVKNMCKSGCGTINSISKYSYKLCDRYKYTPIYICIAAIHTVQQQWQSPWKHLVQNKLLAQPSQDWGLAQYTVDWAYHMKLKADNTSMYWKWNLQHKHNSTQSRWTHIVQIHIHTHAFLLSNPIQKPLHNALIMNPLMTGGKFMVARSQDAWW